MQKSPIRVLRVIPDFKKGGVQAEVMYPARILSKDDVRFDVILLSDTIGYYEKEFKQYGDVFRIPIHQKKSRLQRVLSIIPNHFYVKKEMRQYLLSHEKYDAIHVHHLIYGAPIILAAKRSGIAVRIVHSAIDRPKGQNKNRLYFTLYQKYCGFILRRNATKIFGVTAGAVEYIAGKGNGIVIKNPTLALDRFDPELYPNKNTDGVIRLIMVGSYSSRKNQKFTINVLNELCKIKPDSTLTFIGYPRSTKETYLDEMKKKIEGYGLKEKVRFLPQDTDIPLAMSESTFLLMPSIQEGLPNVALEAQAMGLPCFVSSDVSTECNCGLCHFIDLGKGASFWAKELVRFTEENGFEKQYPDMSEWDNKKICEEYLEYWRGNK